jgi:lysyl-tRNA synthetase class 2
VAPWAGRLTAFTGLVMILSAVSPALPHRSALLAELMPTVWSATAGAAVAAVGILLVLLAGGLRRRKRAAWRAVLVLCLAAVVLNVSKGLDLEESLLAAAMAGLLVAIRDEFQAAADPRSRWAVPAALLGLPAVGTVLGVAFLRFHGVGGASILQQLTTSVYGLVGCSNLGPVVFADDKTADAFALMTGGFGLLTVVVTGWAALRCARRKPTLSDADDAALRVLLGKHGDEDSLGYFALRRDKSVMFSPSGKAAIGYRVLSGVSLASGDPVGDPEAWPGAIEAWLAEAAAHAWVPAVLGCGERAGEAFARHGMDAMELGDEAIVDVDDFCLDGRPMRAVRQAVNRVERAGCVAVVRRVADLTPADVERLASAVDRFRDGATERGFSMALSRLGDPADPECVVVEARDADGNLQGLLHFVPWGADGLSLDLMRRARDSANGMVEFLVVSLLRAAPGLGVRRVSLNFAVFRSVFARGERLGAGPVLRIWRRLLLFASRFWQIESLYRANAKYRPRWEPRFICYLSARDLPRVGIAALRAEAFLVAPQLATPRLFGRKG